MTSSLSVRVRDLTFAYQHQPVLDAFDLLVAPGRLFALLGASGSGKSTLLSLLAGLLSPTRGSIHIGDDDVTHTAARDRRVGVVFQSYALFPHLSVRDNVGFAPRQQGVGRDEIEAVVEDLATRLDIQPLLARRPAQLSGGQQQRVALARALAMRPRLLLLDEPMSNVDPALRTHLRGELRAWLVRWEVTTILVTHDREDAFWLADELGLLRDGRILQRGAPSEVYARPVDLDAARLLGPAEPVAVGQRADGSIDWEAAAPTHTALVRPENLLFTPDPASVAEAESVVDLGNESRVACRLGGVRVWARAAAGTAVGARGRLDFPTPPWVVDGVTPR